jgi:phosphoserine aminotransferase
VDAMYAINQRKAKKLYDFIDAHKDKYTCPIHPENRSMMNVVFTLKDDAATDRFLQESTDAGLTNLKGHRIVGGLRASIYNAMPEAGVDALIKFMEQFH